VVAVPEDHFGESVAKSYDADSAEMFDPAVVEPTVDLLAELAAGGAALEFGIGTGRIALPLAERGVPVSGIDLSAAMVARLRAKPGADRIPVEVGDFATARVDGRFALVYLVFNTINNLTSQEEQTACFRNAAQQLAPGGRFLVEVGVPALQRIAVGERFHPFTVTPTRMGIDEYDVVTQQMWSHHYWIENGGWQSLSVPFRYVWPAELDLMAAMAGMSLVHRWSDWHKSPFTAESGKHVSVWQKPA
jgi:SAM-dependent methyltransferase